MSRMPTDHDLFARAALAHYGRSADSRLRLLSVSENATYLAEDPDGRAEPIVLRLHRPGYHDLDAIASELAWMNALREETDVRTPRVVPPESSDGLVVTAQVGDRSLLVDATELVPGCNAEEVTGALDFERLGQINAEMHRHAQRWNPPADFTRFTWDEDSILGPDARWGHWAEHPALSDAECARIAEAVDVVAQRLGEFGRTPDRFGLVHADLRLTNIMVDPANLGAEPTVIDFDDSGWSWYLADLGAVVSWIEDRPEAEDIIADWLRGYRSVQPLPDSHLAMIPTFVLLRRLNLTGWTVTHADTEAACTVGAEFARGTAELAHRYLTDPTWLHHACAATDH